METILELSDKAQKAKMDLQCMVETTQDLMQQVKSSEDEFRSMEDEYTKLAEETKKLNEHLDELKNTRLQMEQKINSLRSTNTDLQTSIDKAN